MFRKSDSRTAVDISGQRLSFGVESLEDRLMLAGDVLADLNAGNFIEVTSAIENSGLALSAIDDDLDNGIVVSNIFEDIVDANSGDTAAFVGGVSFDLVDLDFSPFVFGAVPFNLVASGINYTDSVSALSFDAATGDVVVADASQLTGAENGVGFFMLFEVTDAAGDTTCVGLSVVTIEDLPIFMDLVVDSQPFTIDDTAQDGDVIGDLTVGSNIDEGFTLTSVSDQGNAFSVGISDDNQITLSVDDASDLVGGTVAEVTYTVTEFNESFGVITRNVFSADITVLSTQPVTGVSLDNGVLNIIGTDGNDGVYVAEHGNQAVVFTSFADPQSFAIADIDSINIDLLDGHDFALVSKWLTIDATIDGGDGSDLLIGGSGEDTIFGGAGNDQIYGRQGADSLDGEDGNDIVSGGSGDDSLVGGIGFDLLIGGGGNDLIDGDDTEDVIIDDYINFSNIADVYAYLLNHWY